jgi:diguanylate cyclase (GGDEF)-like protein
MMDIDHFKAINDTYGHSVGDDALKMFGNTLLELFRESDILGRLGGEEFAALLPETGGQLARSVAQRVCDTLSGRAVDFQGNRITLTVSIGIAELLSGDQSLEDILRRADTTLYQAKAQGRNRIVVA